MVLNDRNIDILTMEMLSTCEVSSPRDSLLLWINAPDLGMRPASVSFGITGFLSVIILPTLGLIHASQCMPKA